MKVLAIIYPDSMGQANNPTVLTQQLADALLAASHGRARYAISFATMQTASPKLPDGKADYATIIAQTNLVARINAGEVAEAWLWGGPTSGYYESRMIGSTAFDCNGPPIIASCPNAVLHGFNSERGLDMALESYSHRVEAIVARRFGGWNNGYNRWPYTGQAGDPSPQPQNLNAWDAFTRFDAQMLGTGGHGNAHTAPNAPAGPWPTNPWGYFTQTPGSWGQGTEAFLRWWLTEMPLDWWDDILLGHADVALATVTFDWGQVGAYRIEVSLDNGPYVLWSSGGGPATAPWIQAGHTYHFRMMLL